MIAPIERQAGVPASDEASLKSLRVLLVEDSPEHADLIEAHLKRFVAELALTRVETRQAFDQALAQEGWDLVLSDYHLPRFSAEQALACLAASGRQVPL